MINMEKIELSSEQRHKIRKIYATGLAYNRVHPTPFKCGDRITDKDGKVSIDYIIGVDKWLELMEFINTFGVLRIKNEEPELIDDENIKECNYHLTLGICHLKINNIG